MRHRPFVVSLALAVSAIGGVAPVQPVSAADVASQTCADLPDGPTVESGSLKSFEAILPRRLVDTREGLGGVAEPVGDGCTLRLDIGAAAVPATAEAVALSVTALGSKPGFLSVFPCSDGVPGTSNINTRDGGFPTPNLVVAIPDASGAVCIFSKFQAEIIIDLTGWWTADGDQRFTSINPVRVDDSRESGTLWPAGVARSIPLGDFIPANATAVVANLTVVDAPEAGFITAFPCGNARPKASNLNFKAFEARAVAIVIGVGAGTSICVESIRDVSVIVDVTGFYAPAPQFGATPGFEPLSGRRLADSRSGEGGWTSKFADGTIRRLTPTEGLPNHSQSTAVVVNVIATEADAPGFVTLYPCTDAVPKVSAVNFAPGGESTNMVTVELSPTGDICVFTRSGVHVIVDLFGVVVADDDTLAERFTVDAFTWPPFTPNDTDYIVECEPGSIDLQLDLLRSTTARVNGVSVASGAVDVPFATDQLISVQLRRGATTQDFHFRCVPDDFPRLEIDRPGNPAPGWYIATLRPPGQPTMFGAILNSRGVPVWYKRINGEFVDVRRRADGRLLLMPNLGPRYGVDNDRGYLVMGFTGTLIAELGTIPDPDHPGLEFPVDHHDIVSMPNGGRALLSYPIRPGDLSALGAGYLVNDEFAEGAIQEIIPGEANPWTWFTSDYFDFDEAPYPQRFGPFPEYAGNEVDVFHLNSLQRVDDDPSGDYIVSARHMDAVFRVDRASGDVDWILRSDDVTVPNKSGAPILDIIGDPLGGPRRQHDARLVGNVLTMFDNRTDTGQPARAVAYEIDEAAGTATMLWQITEPQGRTSLALGSNRPTPDESVLVAWGAAIQPLFGEFTVGGVPLMEITQVGGGLSYRIVKEPLSSFSIDVLRATAGGQVELPGS